MYPFSNTSSSDEAWNYHRWKSTYGGYLSTMFDMISSYKNTYKTIGRKRLAYDGFCSFVYNHSSGYITPYA